MLIENDSARLITLNVAGRAPLNLIPGSNDVDDDHWTELKAKHGHKGDKKNKVKPGFIHCLIKSRDLIEGGLETDEDEDLSVPGNAGDAVNTVRLCEDLRQLKDWLKSETRKTVLKAINEQIEDLSDDTPADDSSITTG